VVGPGEQTLQTAVIKQRREETLQAGAESRQPRSNQRLERLRVRVEQRQMSAAASNTVNSRRSCQRSRRREHYHTTT